MGKRDITSYHVYMFHMGVYENRLLPQIQRFIIMFPVKLARTGSILTIIVRSAPSLIVLVNVAYLSHSFPLNQIIVTVNPMFPSQLCLLHRIIGLWAKRRHFMLPDAPR